MEVTVFNAFENPTIDELEKLLKDKLGDKYKYVVKRKAKSAAGKVAKYIMSESGSGNDDSITVIKNAYHRIVVTLSVFHDKVEKKDITSIYFNDEEISGWLGFVGKQTGFIGRFIIRMIYGTGDGFYEEVEKNIKDNIKGEDETTEYGLGSLFKKKKKDEDDE